MEIVYRKCAVCEERTEFAKHVVIMKDYKITIYKCTECGWVESETTPIPVVLP